MSAQPKCPAPLVLKHLIDVFAGKEQMEDGDDVEIHNALRYLDNQLTSRRMYQRKNQIKRAVILKYAKEHGFDAEIDDAVKMIHGADLEKLALDDTEEDVDG